MNTAEALAADIRLDKAQQTISAARKAAPLLSRDYCGRGAVIVAASDGSRVTVVPTRCKTWLCPHCGPILARLWGERIANAHPERFITLTADATKWPRPDLAYDAMRQAWPKLVRLIRKTFARFQYCLVWEVHESGYPHMHIMQKGTYIPQKWLSAAWQNLGIGQVTDIRRIDSKRGAARYATKYMLKTVRNTRETLGLTRVVTASRGYFPKTLHEESPAKTSDTITHHVLAHPGEVVLALIRDYGYRLDSDTAGNSVDLVPTKRTPPALDVRRMLRDLPRS